MSKAVLISIQPKWCELIANGKKTIEVRKNRPKIDTPFKVYIYCTKPNKAYQTVCGCVVLNSDELYRHPTEGIKHGDSIELMCRDDYTKGNFLNGKVIGEFVCDEIERVDIPYPAYQAELDKRYIEQSCISYYSLHRYFGHDDGYFWHISDLVIYDTPKELGEFTTKCNKNCETGCYDCEHYHFEAFESTMGVMECCRIDGLKPLKRPPQSWCYVET